MTLDCELLRRYAQAESEDAFAELVRRHLDLVYSAALRQVNGDAHLAQDVAQTVFSDLARKAAGLSHRPVLTGWLYTSTHFAAAKAVRTERRRHAHEQEAQAMHEILHDPAPDFDWEKLRPMLDQVMHELKEIDREVILMRYFENRQLADIGERLGLSEDAARKRVDRALEKLRAFLSKRGVSVASGGLVVVISANAIQTAPVGLATAISTAAALAGTTIATTTTATATKAIAMTTLQKALIAVSIVAAGGTGIYEGRQASSLRNQVQTLQKQQAPLAEQNLQLQGERDDATRQLAALRNENERLTRNTATLAKLRAEVASLRQQQPELARLQEENQRLRMSVQTSTLAKPIGADSPSLYLRIFSIKPATFLENLNRQVQAQGDATVSEKLVKFFEQNGLTFEPPVSVYFDERRAAILVRNTLTNLDTVESLILSLSKEK